MNDEEQLAQFNAELARTRWSWEGGSGRWYVEGEPVHAGATLELAGYDYSRDEDNPDSVWIAFNIESEDCGRVLVAYNRTHGIPFAYRVAEWRDGKPRVLHRLRQPRR